MSETEAKPDAAAVVAPASSTGGAGRRRRGGGGGEKTCYNCGADTLIFLHAAEVWKYGITIQGEKGRYPNTWITALGLRYRVQYRGSIQDCLQQETLKIYQYALLPENLKRAVPLMRPPGTKVDL